MARNCYVCQSYNTGIESFSLPDSSRILKILICYECGHASRVDQPDFATNLQNQEDRFAKKTQEPRSNPHWYSRRNLIASQIERMVCTRGKIKILDIGCGSGQWLAVLSERWDKYGVDVSSVAAEIAQRCTGANVFCGPIEAYEAEPESFDVITAFALIEHLKDPRKLMQWVYKRLKRGGIVVLMTGDRESKIAKRFGHKWPLYVPPEHMYFFSSRSLNRLVTETGFTVKRREWRNMPYGSRPLTKLCELCIGRVKEILRLTGKPYYDHLYIYAQKPL